MKPSSIAILSLSAVLLLAMFYTNNLLVKEYVKIDLSDSLRSYSVVDSTSFRFLHVSGSNGYTIEIRQGEKPEIKVLRSRLSHVTKEHKGDTLYLNLSGANITSEQADVTNTPVGIYIRSPRLSQVNMRDTRNKIIGLHENDFELQLEGRASVVISHCRFTNLSIAGKDYSWFEFKKDNVVESLTFSLENMSVGNFSKVDFSVLHPHLGDSAKAVFSHSTLEEMMKQNESY